MEVYTTQGNDVRFDPNRPIIGRFGTLWYNGQWVANVNESEGRIELEEADIPMTGELWIATKIGGLRGTLRFRGFKITDELVEFVLKDLMAGKTPRLDFITKIADPQAYGVRRVHYKNCTPSQNLPLDNFAPNNEPVDEEWNWRFYGIDLLDVIRSDKPVFTSSSEAPAGGPPIGPTIPV